MVIKTKFEVGENVYLLQDNKVVTKEVISIVVKIYEDTYKNTVMWVKYHLKGYSKDVYFIEEDNLLHATKEDLLNSL